MNDYLHAPVFLISVSFALCLCLTIYVRSKLAIRALLDYPNARSSHKIPIPRGGGWAVLSVVIPGLLLAVHKQGSLATYLPIICGTVVLAAISWLDDRKGVSAIARLSLHVFIACLGSLAFTENETLFSGALPFWLDRIVMILGWAWFINLYNFMDGIDGITSTETICLASGVFLLIAAAGLDLPFVETLTLLLTGSCLGFLALNWYPAKIFLGDVGSVPLGFLTGFALLALATKGYLVSALILPLYYLADSGLTLIKRALKCEKIWQAHRQHFYQRAAEGIGSHAPVVYWIIIVNIGLISAALTAVQFPLIGLSLGLVAVALLLWKMHKTSL